MKETTPPNFIYDAEQLSAFTSAQQYRLGLIYYKENRVFECHQNEDTLFASVEGNNRDIPYSLKININDSGNLSSVCDCGNIDDSLCKHAIASLLLHKEEVEHLHDQQHFLSLRDQAIKGRIKRGQTEVKVAHQDGHPVFGIFNAQSITDDSPWARSYQVHIRSLTEQNNYCNCPDLLNNQLGTCKHIEAVLHNLRKKSAKKPTNMSAPLPFIFYNWQSEQKLALQRTANMDEGLSQLLSQYFDQQGNFSGSLPDDFFTLQNALYGNNQVIMGEDAIRYVQQLANEQSHKLKRQEISKQIQQLNGKIPSINATLYPYQVEGMAFLAANGRALLADDMGLGKTLQAICASTWLINQAKVQRVLIICPTSLKQQWAREIEKFSGFTTQIIGGNAEKRSAQYNKKATFFIINYELILRDLSQINELLSPDLIILDEAQRIKNWRTKVASATKLIVSRYAFVLSGTPLENKLEELYSLMQVVNPNILGPLWRYMSDYHVLDESGKVIGYRNLTALRKAVSTTMLRRDRSIVSDQLPSKTCTQIDVAMDCEQQELHDNGLAAASRLANIAKTRPLTPSENNRMMAALQQTRMACNAAGLVDKNTEGSPKLDELKVLIEELCLIGGEKMVVFSQWKGMTLMIEKLLSNMGIEFVHLHGGVASDKRGALIDKFNQDDAVKIFISTDAGGSGLNLQTASVLVNMDLPWNPAVLEQRNARVHRLGQKNKVQIIMLVAADSYEQRVLQLITNKQDLFDNVISPEAEQDIVGITKKSLSAVLNELNEQSDQNNQSEQQQETEESLAQQGIIDIDSIDAEQAQLNQAANNVEIPEELATHDEELIAILAMLQQRFGERIEQILAKNAGLLVIVDQLDDEIEAFINALNPSFGIAAIDCRTQRQLAKLGLHDPLVDATPINIASVNRATNLWQQKATDKLASAQLLFENQQDGVIDLLVTALSACITEKAAKTELMQSEELPVWLFSEGVPKEKISDQQASSMLRILSLKYAPVIPRELQQQALTNTQTLLAEFYP